ncbi:MAG: hypothetical protein SGI90_16215 [Candidatus Eisenbacteria bacterium]|nr:hypothetical protein [Candidatus Eisenbacteria bacterium]
MSASLRRIRLSLVTLATLLALGLSASNVRAQADECCLSPDNGTGTATLPPTVADGTCLYVGSGEIVDGLPLGTTIQISATYGFFNNVTEFVGGTLAGTRSDFSAIMTMTMTGTGALLGFNRVIPVPLPFGAQRISWSPRVANAAVQNVLGDLERLSGQVTGDPDFDLLRITGGGDFGMPSPGQAQLVTSAGQWATSSFFDIQYRIDFVGKPGGALAGMSGSTTRTRRFTMCPRSVVPVLPSTWTGIKALLLN